MFRRGKYYFQLMRLDRPIGTMLLLWPTLWGVWIAADGRPTISIVLIFVAGVFLMRAAGCVINDYFDRDVDAKVQRTQNRPLAAGKIHPIEALIVFALLASLALLLLYFLNSLSRWVALVAMLLAISYPLCKRVTQWPQAVLGLAFSCGIIMAFTSQQNAIPLVAWVLVASNTALVLAYDTYYAMVDVDDDRHLAVGSTALLFGEHALLFIAFFHITAVSCLLLAGFMLNYPGYYYFGLASATGLAGWQLYQAYKFPAKETYWQNFLLNNWFGAVVFAGIVSSTIFIT